ncbi:hypothetical protein [Paenibacillus prosopidis]|uniref:Uncharacterized protein n=1 Tax=Paenibacillus prosopidis TaxID=630520 RepID=A0A368VIX5_9BACL|nr:hypothetical protein [Paenibacillus prosopidis]RCW40341.1 hypothetical protein DFP97_1353 [Paenibacillus prosopidis]
MIENKIIIKVILPHNTFNEKNIKMWLDFLLWFTPTDMAGNLTTGNKIVPFQPHKFYENLNNEVAESRFSIRLSDENSNISIAKLQYQTTVSVSAANIDIKEIMYRIEKLIVELEAITAFAMDKEDFFWQSNKDPNNYKRRNKSLNNVKIIKDPRLPRREIIDPLSLPGYIQYFHEIGFTSSWKMWFGPLFYKYIPFERLVAFKGGYETLIINESFVRITLYKNSWEYDDPQNRAIQWDCRRSLEIDTVVEQLRGIGNRTGNTDPSIEFITTDLQYGGDLRVKYYYNSEGKLVPRSKSVSVIEYEMKKSGEVQWKEIRST